MKIPRSRCVGRLLVSNRVLLGLISVLALVSRTTPAYIASHTFSVRDVLGGFDGVTFGNQDEESGSDIICEIPPFTMDGTTYETSTLLCPLDAPEPIFDKDGTQLYPIDSEFGFKVVDFAGAAQKTRDYDYQEGFVGNAMEGDNVVGLKVSNAATDFYKVPPPLGTWCQGLGANSVKCSTEHFSVMEHILTCHETIPYMFADTEDGTQAQFVVHDSDPLLKVDCADTELDNILYVLRDGEITEENYEGDSIQPNDNTDALNNIAVSSSYSVTLKDDLKVLYRWGSLIKRPNDIRMYAKIPLPAKWKETDLDTGKLVDIAVTKAYLVVDHLITNNPNDQLRAEDLENEGATGRKPDYRVSGDGKWLSTKDCYEGDGDFIPVDTVFKQDLDLQVTDANNEPITPSKDLEGKFTNAFYTTTDRDPFEWSYRVDSSVPDLYDFVGFEYPLTAEEEVGYTLVSGPRWRLKANKFGQDVPGLEIPAAECSQPPYEKDNIKYEVGTRVNTYINLLDWNEADGEKSPLSTSRGWVNVDSNSEIEINPKHVVTIDGEEYPVSTNGLPMTDDFDLAVYIKGDKKPTTIYSATLILDYDGAPDDADNDDNLVVDIIEVEPATPIFDEEFTVKFVIRNIGTQSALAEYSAIYEDSRGNSASYKSGRYVFIGDSQKPFEWKHTRNSPAGNSGNLKASVTISVAKDLTDDGDIRKATIDFPIKK